MTNASPRWKLDLDILNDWIEGKETIFKHGLTAEPTVKILILLALIDAKKACTYADIRNIFIEKNIINGNIPDNTLRTSALNLIKTLNKIQHFFEIKSERGKFELLSREAIISDKSEPIKKNKDSIILFSPLAVKPKYIAQELIEKSRIPCHALYLLDWSARWWEIFSHSETEIRVKYETDALDKLKISDRILQNSSNVISFVSIAAGEGLAEIQIIKKLLKENPEKSIHYLAVDLSQRLLRQHISLLKESISSNILNERLICTGISADIFNNFSNTLNKIKNDAFKEGLVDNSSDFLPSSSAILVTYLGNCLGNHYQDQESEIFSIIHNVFKNRPLEFLVGVSVMRSTPDIYKRNWDEFLLQTPKHLMETNFLLDSSRSEDSDILPEFCLPQDGEEHNRCPSVIPEPYFAQHGIEGKIYRFYYKLAFDLKLSSKENVNSTFLPKGSLILLYNIIKYKISTLVAGIKAGGIYNVKYDDKYHKTIDTPNGTREYAVFSAYID